MAEVMPKIRDAADEGVPSVANLYDAMTERFDQYSHTLGAAVWMPVRVEFDPAAAIRRSAAAHQRV